MVDHVCDGGTANLVAALLHRFGETSVTITKDELQGASLGCYHHMTAHEDPTTGAVTYKLVGAKSTDPELFPSDENLQSES